MSAWVLLLAAVAQASLVTIIPAGRPEGKRLMSLVSADGYHWAVLTERAGRQTWYKDGRKIADAPQGAYLPDRAALSDDGSVLAAARRVHDKDGRELGFVVEVNGKAGLKRYRAVGHLTVGPRGHVAYSAETAEGWRVVTAKGEGPAFRQPPHPILVNAAGAALYVERDKVSRLYLDHKFLRDWAPVSLHADPGWTQLAGKRKHEERWWMEIDDKPLGPYDDEAAGFVFDRTGAHHAFFAGRSTIVLDGRPHSTAEPARQMIVFDPLGMPHWLVKTPEGVAVSAGGTVGKSYRSIGGNPFIAFSPTGRNWAHSASEGKGGIIVNGERRLAKHPDFLAGGFVFDSEDEFHALINRGGEIALACLSVKPMKPEASICAKRASLYQLDGD